MSFLRSRYARMVSLVLALQLCAFYAIASRAETAPFIAPLSVFPTLIQGWGGVRDIPIEQETLDILRADDTLNRLYTDPVKRSAILLFIAYFKTQRYGQSPHSPRNCLPGSGWEPVPGMSGRQSLQVPGEAQPIVINKYVTSHGDDLSVTLYWYQSHGRVIASEWDAKFWSIADSIRYHRSDTSIVKITIPVVSGDVDTAAKTGYDFARAAFPELLRQLPM